MPEIILWCLCRKKLPTKTQVMDNTPMNKRSNNAKTCMGYTTEEKKNKSTCGGGKKRRYSSINDFISRNKRAKMQSLQTKFLVFNINLNVHA